MEALAKALRDIATNQKECQAVSGPSIGIDLMACRWALGLDIWTGEPLKGEARHDWLRLRADDEE